MSCEEPSKDVYPFRYKGHRLVVTRKRKNYYTANYTLNGKEYYSGNSDVDKILKYFRSNVDKLMEKNMKELTYEDVVKEWGGSRYKRISYKDEELKITAFQEVRNFPLSVFDRVFYVGELDFYKKGEYNSKRTSFESIHYNKVVSKFQRFVDEYCTEWQARAGIPYKGYIVKIDQERDKEFYIGYVQFHKNSTFKHIADTREEVERYCKNRIDRVIYEKEKIKTKMLSPKQEKIQELEQLQARISAQLEELKKEKDTWIYKGIVLEYGVEEGLQEGYMIGRIRNAPEGTLKIYGRTVEAIKSEFEEYIDELEKSHYIFNMIRPEIKNRY